MIARRTLLGLVAGGAAILLAGCGGGDTAKLAAFYPPYRYALKAEIETPQGVHAGSGVIEVKWSYRSFKVTGQAVAVDLPNGETLFLALRSSSSEDWAAYAHEWTNIRSPANLTGEDASEAYWHSVASDRGIYPVKRRRVTAVEDSDNYPYFVRFRDIRDPRTVELVDPDNLAATFGPGYRLKSLTIHMTDAPVTTGIKERLGWLSEHPEPRLQSIPVGGVTDPTFAQKLSHGDFRKK